MRSFQCRVLSLSALGVIFLSGSLSFADPLDGGGEGGGRRRDPWQNRRHESHMSFQLGLCAGQALASQGISVPVRTPGQPPEPLDSSTQAALQSAIQACRSELEGTGTGASPTPGAPSTSAPTAPSSSTPAPTDSSSARSR